MMLNWKCVINGQPLSILSEIGSKDKSGKFITQLLGQQEEKE